MMISTTTTTATTSSNKRTRIEGTNEVTAESNSNVINSNSYPTATLKDSRLASVREKVALQPQKLQDYIID